MNAEFLAGLALYVLDEFILVLLHYTTSRSRVQL
jgi:hypothetical protein